MTQPSKPSGAPWRARLATPPFALRAACSVLLATAGCVAGLGRATQAQVPTPSQVARPADQPTPAPVFDLVIHGGSVIDGSGSPRRTADLAIAAGRIVAIGALDDAQATRRIDAKGLVVAPGFLDVHAHADLVAARRGGAENYVLMGVTTIVTGNCGGSVEAIGAHLAEVKRRGISVNYATLIGHGTVRRQVMGDANRAPSAEELASMRALVSTAMDEGAFGISTGLIYVPGTYADTDELVALCEEVATRGGIYASHMRNEADDVLASIGELLEIGRRSGVAVHASHLKASGKPNWGRGVEIVEALRAARAAGQRVTGDQYAYTASSTGLEVLFPTAELTIGLREFGERLAQDQEFRERMREALRKVAAQSGFEDFAYAQIARAPGDEDLNGKRFDAVAELRFGSRDLEQQIEAIFAVMQNAKGRRVQMVYHKMCEQDVECLLREDYVAIAADAGIRMFDAGDKPHPRGSGNNPRVLGHYVRERGILSLELAVRKMTALPAAVFGLRDRGTIAVGSHADLVLFDAATIADRATYEDPLASPIGIHRVFVNGVEVAIDGEHTKARPGKILRRTQPDD